MAIVDSRGRLFGRINLFDAAVAGFAIVLIPLAYGTFLLFRTPRASITAVRSVEITKEERRVGGPALTAKLKVQGTGLRPLLRAFVGDAPAIGFVFENPNSADVLVGAVPPGSHDLILYDGVQEVARAARAVTIQPAPPSRLRIVGTLVGLDKTTAEALSPGRNDIVRLGPVRPDARPLRVRTGEIDLPIEGLWARDAVISVRCDPDPDPGECTVGGRTLSATPPPVVTISGPSAPLSLAVGEVLPESAPREVLIRVRFEGAAELLALIKDGDRDRLLDERAATIVRQSRSQSGGVAAIDATLRLGADAVQDGWSYRGRSIVPGEIFRFTTNGYVVSGSILDVNVAGATAETGRR